MNLNPALAGNFDGDHRFIGNQRNQWRSISPNPYSTFAGSFDTRDIPKTNKLRAGLSLFQDRTGDSQFNTLKLGLSVAYPFHLPFLADTLHHFSGGIQGLFVQKKLEYDDLSFDNQYNGFFYDPSRSTGENFPREQRSYPDLGGGIHYRYTPADRKGISAGISLFNILKPKQSLFNNGEVVLDRRFSFHAGGQYPLAEKWDLLPGALFAIQGKYREILLGSRFRYILKDHLGVYRALYGGLWMRSKDAAYMTIGMDYNTWHVGLSYDLNLSDLRPASNYRGGFEISVEYIIKHYEREPVQHKVCPTFI